MTSFSLTSFSRRRFGFFAAILAGLLLVLFLLSLTLGKYSISLDRIAAIALSPFVHTGLPWSRMDENILLEVRAPRALAAVFIGAGLAASGAVFQGLFRNPLASPYTLGVSNGAGFGAALAILLWDNTWMVQVWALVFALVSVFLALRLGKTARHSTVTLVLAGVIVGSLFAALVSFIKFTADPFDKLPAIVFWLMGSLASVNTTALWVTAPVMALLLVLLTRYGWRINILSLGDAEAQSYGVDIRRARLGLILSCSLLAAISVSLAGVIGWIGLVVPHLARTFTGPDYRRLLPVSSLLGGMYLLVIDDFCRLMTGTEVPLGVVTALIGTPVFAYFMLKGKVSW